MSIKIVNTTAPNVVKQEYFKDSTPTPSKLVSEKGFFVTPLVTGVKTFELSQAYISRETADGRTIYNPSSTLVNLIKGKTVKSTNLIPFPTSLFNENRIHMRQGITYKCNADMSISISGSTSSDYSYLIFTDYFNNLNYGAGVYTISADGFIDGVSIEVRKIDVNGNSVQAGFASKNTPFTITLVEGEFIQRLAISIDPNTTVDTVIYPMLNEGSTAKPFTPYFSGLKHANFKSIKSTGKNVLKVKDYTNTYGGVTVSVKDNKFTATGTATDHIVLWLPLEAPLQAGTYSSIIGTEQKLFGTGVTALYLALKNWDYDNRKDIANGSHPVQNATTNFVSNYMALYIAKGNEVNCSLDLMLNIGSTAQPYEPYKVEEYGDGNSYELAEYDYINPQKGELVRQTGYATSETGFTTEEIANYNEPIVSVDNKSLEYRLENPIIELVDYPKEYTAYNGGSETVEQGDTDNSQWGANCEITNTYVESYTQAMNTIKVDYSTYKKECGSAQVGEILSTACKVYGDDE